MTKQKNKKTIYFGIIVSLLILIILLININLTKANTPCPSGFPSGAICDGTLTNFFLTNNENLFCENQGYNWVNWSTNSPVIVLNTTGAPINGGTVNCYSPDGANENYCCPSGFSCVNSGGGVDFYGNSLHHCEYTGIFYCWHYEDAINCSGDISNVAEDSVEFLLSPPNPDYCGNPVGEYWLEGTATCANISKCLCFWDVGDSKCYAKSELYKDCSDNPGHGPSYSNCTYILDVINNCNTTGKIIYNWTVFGIGIFEPTSNNPGGWVLINGWYYNPRCIPGSRTILCESMVKLGFFDNLFGIITIILVLIIIYYLNEQKKKNVKGRKENKNLKEKKEKKDNKKKK